MAVKNDNPIHETDVIEIENCYALNSVQIVQQTPGLETLIEKIFEICETYGGDYQSAQLRQLLTDWRNDPTS